MSSNVLPSYVNPKCSKSISTNLVEVFAQKYCPLWLVAEKLIMCRGQGCICTKKYYPHGFTHERPNFQMCNANVFHVLLHMAIYNTNANGITCYMSDCARGHNARVHMRPINTSEQAGGRPGRVGQS